LMQVVVWDGDSLTGVVFLVLGSNTNANSEILSFIERWGMPARVNMSSEVVFLNSSFTVPNIMMCVDLRDSAPHSWRC
jgi:hypothetical protein